jgi:RNA polymerase sigma-70 factor, ECF subfamily
MKLEAPPAASNPGERTLAPASRTGAEVIPLPIPEADEALVSALRAGHPTARAALFDRHAEHVRRVLVRVLGVDHEIPDLLQEVFLTALTTIGSLDDPRALRAWLTSIAVHQARGLIRKRSRRRILGFVAPEELERQLAPASGTEHHEAIRALYRVLEHMPADERIAWALRFVDGMELHEIAGACRISRATVSRRLRRAEDLFLEHARRYEALAGWLEGGARWNR